jgi:hypothetical protein
MIQPVFSLFGLLAGAGDDDSELGLEDEMEVDAGTDDDDSELALEDEVEVDAGTDDGALAAESCAGAGAGAGAEPCAGAESCANAGLERSVSWAHATRARPRPALRIETSLLRAAGEWPK